MQPGKSIHDRCHTTTPPVFVKLLAHSRATANITDLTAIIILGVLTLIFCMMPIKKRKASSGAGDSTTISKVTKKTKTTVADRTKSSRPKSSKKKGTPYDPIDLDEDDFYSSGTGNFTASPVQQNLNKLFDSYRDQPTTSPDKILIEGAQKYLSSLNIALDEVSHLALCDLLSSTSIGEFDRTAFTDGWSTISTPTNPLDTIARQQSHIKQLKTRLATDPAYFKQVYRSAFKLAKPESQRSVPLDAAIEFWRMCFSSSSGGVEWNTKTTPWLDLWCEFYETQSKRPVNKDLWNMLGELVAKTKEPGGEKLEWWSEDAAWPTAIDDFVAWMREKRKVDGEAGEADAMETD